MGALVIGNAPLRGVMFHTGSGKDSMPYSNPVIVFPLLMA